MKKSHILKRLHYPGIQKGWGAGKVSDKVPRCLTWRVLELCGPDKDRLSPEDRGTII